MVQIDVPAAFAVGGFLADAARTQIQAGNAEYTCRAGSKNCIFQIFFFSWIPVYFILNYFGWETTYMWWTEDSVTAYPFFVPVFLVIFFLAGLGGFFVGKKLVTRGRLLANRIIYLGITLFSLIWVFGQTGRTFRAGTYSQWKAQQAPLFYQDHTFLAMFIISMVVWLAGVFGFYINLRREGARLSKAAS
ncbi:MAG TPA: hypothetical protein VFD30_17110 [Terriglobia bacterium]|jgi:hypothetical protein|nr:hypothetical protein [Terriglobia bacterium]